MKATSYRAINPTTGHAARSGNVVNGLSFDDAAALLAAEYAVAVLPSGSLTFALQNGTPVSLYLRIDPNQTEKGRDALRAHSKARAETQARDDAKRAELLALVDSIGVDAALSKLIR